MKCSFALSALAILTLVAAIPDLQNSWRPLFNGKDLTGWDTYVGPEYDSAKKDFAGAPIGLNRDPNQVFRVLKVDGKEAIRISGENFGGISTTESFENYHLHLEFRWGKSKWHPRKTGKRDSGVLYHAVGPHGADGNFWMRSQEFQVQEEDCGDYWGVAGGVFDVPVVASGDKSYRYDPAGTLTTFREGSEAGRHCIRSRNAEKPWGQWNAIDIYCMGDTSVHAVNGETVMVLYDSRQREGDKETPLTKGKIQIQSEGAEVFYRDIRIRPIAKIPDEMLRN
jgi:hypothetical protein